MDLHNTMVNQQNSGMNDPTMVQTTVVPNSKKLTASAKGNGVNARNEGDHLNTYNGFGGDQQQLRGQQPTMPASAPGYRQKQSPLNSMVYNSNKSLQEWLENCSRDRSSFMSSEFLEANGRDLPTMMQPPSTYRSNLQFPDFPVLPNMEPPNSILNRLNNSPRIYSTDYASLPHVINSSIDGKNQTSDLLDDNGELARSIANDSRFSDPCLANISETGDQSDINSISKTTPSNPLDNNKVMNALLKQITLLHDTNTKICRRLHENKVEIEALKHAPNWGLRHRRDSLSGLSTHSTPLGGGGGYMYGTQSPAPTFHSGTYTPGMMTDVVREVKEAARIREEALMGRVQSLLDERNWLMNESNLKISRDIDELKTQVQQLKNDKFEQTMRISRLEEEVKLLRATTPGQFHYPRSTLSHTNSFNENDYSRPKPRNYFELNKTMQKRLNANINYGTINCTEDAELEIPPPVNQKLDEIFSQERRKYSKSNKNRHSIAEIPNKIEEREQMAIKLEKDTIELRKELQDALTNRQMAESKIAELQNYIRLLHETPSINGSTYSNPESPQLVSESADSETGVNHNQLMTAAMNASQIQMVAPQFQNQQQSNNGIVTTNGPVTDL